MNHKGLDTKENILKTAFELTSMLGLESLSIGKLADSVGLSKSGLFSHFKSKEKLQIMVLDYTAEIFTLKVLSPATKRPRGLPRLNAIAENWIKQWDKGQLKGGCPLLAAAIEFDDRPGKVHKKIQELYQKLTGFFQQAAEIAVAEGHFRKDANCEQFAFELYSLMTGQQIYSRLLKGSSADTYFEQSFQRLIQSYQPIQG